MSLRDELDEIMNEPLRSDPMVLDIQVQGADTVMAEATPAMAARMLRTALAMNRGQRLALLRLADEIDELRGTESV